MTTAAAKSWRTSIMRPSRRALAERRGREGSQSIWRSCQIYCSAYKAAFAAGLSNSVKRNDSLTELPCHLGAPPVAREPSLSDEEGYRKQAEDCRQMAAKAISPLDKEAWLKLAEMADHPEWPEKLR
jgi:hypothetical protein